MNSIDSKMGMQEKTASCNEEKLNSNDSFRSLFSPSVLNTKICSFKVFFRNIRQSIIDNDLFSVWLFLLAMPTLGIMIQCLLFFFGITCSAFPMWFSFLFFSALSLLIHWKKLLLFWGLTFLGLFLCTFTFSYDGVDAEIYHIPMQILLREGWNPIFDSTIEKFSRITNIETLYYYHTLFLPKTVALCGALVAKASGLWIANSFLGYLLFFVMLRTSFVFAKRIWKFGRTCCLLFSAAVSCNSIFSALIEGMVDFHLYAALIISSFSIILYLREHMIYDLVLAVIASAICCTTKTTGLTNSIVLWGAFGLYSWKRKETYLSIAAVALLIIWIGMSPFVTSWIQYGSPFYPLMTFDPQITPVDITDDFHGNADGDLMGYIARFVYAWLSPGLAKKACALYYHKADFNPTFVLPVTRGVGGYGTSLNVLFFFSIVAIILAKKNSVSFLYLFLLLTLILCPVQYIGYERYFPQAWVLIPLGLYQFCAFPPAWLNKKEKIKRTVQYGIFFVLSFYTICSIGFIFAFQTRSMIIEGKRQAVLESYRKENTVFDIPHDLNKGFFLSKRLYCGNVPYSFSPEAFDLTMFIPSRFRSIDMNDPQYICLKKYIYDYRYNTLVCYDFDHNPLTLLRFKWLDLFRYFPHPLFYREMPQSSDLNIRKKNKPQPFYLKQ